MMSSYEEIQLDQYLDKVLNALERGDRAALRSLGQQDGFVSNYIRRLVWPYLLECPDHGYALYSDQLSDFPELDERDITTIKQDVNRSFTRFSDLEPERREELEGKLYATLKRVLRLHPRMHYFQGYHDVAEVLLLVTDEHENLTCKLLHRLSLFNIRDMLLPSLEPTLHSLDMIPAILHRVDKVLYHRVLIAIRPPHFAASAIMTMFSHDVEDMDRISNIFDFLISSPPVIIFYLAAAIIVNAKLEILDRRNDEEDDEFTIVYTRLVKVFRGRIPITIVFPLATKLLKENPPEKLDAYRSLSQWSCFKSHVDEIGDDWIEKGSELLHEATEEQYQKKEETQTELARREKTVIRQEIADDAMLRHSWEKDQVEMSPENLRKRINAVKEEAMRDGLRRWKAMEEERVKDAQEQKERLLRAHEIYKYYEKDKRWDLDLQHWSLLVGGGIAIAAITFAVIKGYQSK